MSAIHQSLADGRWQQFTLAEQLGNVGSEVHRAMNQRGKDERLFQGAVDRALELLDLTIEDPRWKKRLREILRAREALCDAVLGSREYGNSLEDLDRYFFDFALAAHAYR